MCEVQCDTCFHRCRLAEGQTGLCRARQNRDGSVVCLNYGRVTALALDPIEKKPLARFCPGSSVLSVGSFGCNLSCPFCQNDSISCADLHTAPWQTLAPGQLADMAAGLRSRGNIGVAYTYNEPMVGWEFVRDTARLVRQKGMKNVVVTNGSVLLPVLEQVLPYIDAFNIDLKGFTGDWYRRLGGDLATVQDFIVRASGASHVELTTLVVPGENDTPEEMDRLAAWGAGGDENIPLHVTRFFPRHNMRDRPATAPGTVLELCRVAGARLRYVCPGNL